MRGTARPRMVVAILAGAVAAGACGGHGRGGEAARRIVETLRVNVKTPVVQDADGKRTTVNYRFDVDGDAVRIVMDRWVGTGTNTLEIVTLPVNAIDPSRIMVRLEPRRLPAAWGVPEQVVGDRHRVTIAARTGRWFGRTVEGREARFRSGESRFREGGGGRTGRVDRVVVWTEDRAHAEALARGIRDALH